MNDTAATSLLAGLGCGRLEHLPGFVAGLRRRGRDRFAELGFPTPRLEEWRFTSLRQLAETPFEVAGAGDASTPVTEPWILPGAHRLVLVNGRFAPELSTVNDLPAGTVFTGLGDAIQRCPEIVEAQLGRLAGFSDRGLVALNTALLEDGAFLWLPTGTVVERPIQLLFVASDQQRPIVNAPRTLIVAGRSSQARVIETYAGIGGNYLSCAVTEIAVGSDAVEIDHYRLSEEAPEASHVGSLDVDLDRAASFASHSFALGGALTRTDLGVVLDGEGADATLDGLYLTDGRRHVDHHVTVRHAKPHCTSHQLFKGVLDGRSRAVFNGRIIVDRDAQKTDARQSNRNLLLSDRAMVNSNPQLEIFADDVRCTHGSTVGRLDEDALFYLRTRGLSRAAAENLLVYAFAAELVQRVEVEGIRGRLEEQLAALLPGGVPVQEAV